MEENSPLNQETENQEITSNPQEPPFYEAVHDETKSEPISDSELSEIENFLNENIPIPELVLRHSQQILSNKQVQILLMKKEEELTDMEKSVLKLFLLRARHHNSRPKLLSSKVRKNRKKRRTTARASRKANR